MPLVINDYRLKVAIRLTRELIAVARSKGGNKLAAVGPKTKGDSNRTRIYKTPTLETKARTRVASVLNKSD